MLQYQLVFFLFVGFISGEEVGIAGIFEQDKFLEKAFTYAVESANKLKAEDDLSLSPMVQNTLEDDDEYSALQETCKLLNTGIIALFGPRSLPNIEIVQSVCDIKEIPHIVTRWKSTANGGTEVNFYPHPPVLAQAYMDIIRAWGWTSFTALYEDNESFTRISILIEMAKDSGMVVNIKQLDPLKTGNFRDSIKELKFSNQKYVLIDCTIESLGEVLKELQQFGLVNENYNYFMTNLDAHTEDLEPFQYSNCNITGIRLINPDSEYVQSLATEMFSESDSEVGAVGAWSLRTEQALIIDAVHMFVKALKARTSGSPIPIVEESNSLPCTEQKVWKHGYSLVNMLKTSFHEGLTGIVKFNQIGVRTEFSLNLFELKEGGVTDIGTWNASSGLNLSRLYPPEVGTDEDSLKNKTFIVQITLTEPYGMLKESSLHLTGNTRFEGFAVDLIAELGEMEGFNYTFVLREDKKNGAYDKVTKKWSGMIGDLLEYKTDLAITDFTITSGRAEVVDFTVPFMSLGISILFQKPKNAPPSFFSFADPFALDTWIALAMAYFIVALSLFVIGRICADEWTNPYPCIEEPEYLCNQFSLANSIWFVTGSLMAQGSEIAPIAMSTRMVAGMWWFFCLIIVASYTANLAAFLATENPVELFKDLQTLYENKYDINYGAKDGGATLGFFTGAEEGTLFYKIGQRMTENPQNVKENDEGVKRAESENEYYAFFMESTSIEYTVQRHCSLKQYGKQLDEKGYGIAMRKGSPYRKRLSLAILKLQSSGYIDQLKRKWWEERRGGGQCEGQVESSEADPLKLVNVGGCFWVTIYGTVLAAMIVSVEHILYVFQLGRKLKVPFTTVFMQELQFYLDFNSDVKPVLSKESLDKSKTISEEALDGQEDQKSKKSSVKSRSKSRLRSRSRSTSKSRSKTKSHEISKSKSSKSSGSQSNGKLLRPYGFVFSQSTDRLEETL